MKFIITTIWVIVICILSLNILYIKRESRGAANRVLAYTGDLKESSHNDSIAADSTATPEQRKRMSTQGPKPFGDFPTSWFEASKAERLLNTEQDMLLSYRDAFSTLGLTHDQLVKLKSLLLERVESIRDAWELSRKEGLSDNGALSVRREVENEVDKEIQDLIGPQAANTVRIMLNGKQYFTDVENGYAWDFDYYGCPATAEQKKELAILLYHEASRDQDPLGQITKSNNSTTDQDSDILDHASTILTNQQLEVLRTDFKYERAAALQQKDSDSN